MKREKNNLWKQGEDVKHESKSIHVVLKKLYKFILLYFIPTPFLMKIQFLMTWMNKILWIKTQIGWDTSWNLISFVTIIVVSSKPEVILLPKCLYNSPKHCAAPIKIDALRKWWIRNRIGKSLNRQQPKKQTASARIWQRAFCFYKMSL